MTVKKIGISLSKEALRVAQKAVAQGRAVSISGCIDDLLRAEKEASDTKRFLAEWEAELGMTDAERTRIDRAYGLGRYRKPKKPRKAS